MAVKIKISQRKIREEKITKSDFQLKFAAAVFSIFKEKVLSMNKGVFSGRNYEAAVSEAERTLDILRQNLDIKIIEEGSRGIFGLGCRNVVIQVSERLDCFLKKFLETLFFKMQLDCMISDCVFGGESINVTLSAPNPNQVIGRNAEILDALQYIANLAVNKRDMSYNDSKFIRVTLDIDGYRKRRENAVRDLAMSAAQRVKKSGKSVALPVLNSYERHLVHELLEPDPLVTTRSTGEGSQRRVVIFKSVESKETEV